MSNFEDVAKQFTEFYYNTFDQDRSKLEALYREGSMLTFEGAAVQGGPAIIEKLTSLPFTQIKHQVSTLDAQPASSEGNILVVITGALLVDEEQKAMSYSQTFQLARDPSGNYFVFNDMFRLVYSS